jgi:hypothetical protein
MSHRYQTANSGPFKSTGQFCGASKYWGDRCGACPEGAAAPGVAAAYSADQVTPTKVMDCDAIPTSTDGPVTAVAYCCLTPFFEISGPTDTPKSCDAVCAAEGLNCTTKGPVWAMGLYPGAAVVYWRSATGGRWDVEEDCSVAPKLTKVDGTQSYTLDYHTCECIDPQSPVPTPP